MSWLNSFLLVLTSVQPYMVPATVIGLVSFAFFCFILFYLSRTVKIVNSLKKYTQSINGIDNSDPANQLQHLQNLFVQPELKHAWREFAESLHPQHELVGSEEKIVKIRATAPSASYFSEQQLVDIPLNTEFFKHLPGILTGVGIIGTFYGLMIGLNHFDASTPEQVTSSIDRLLHDVLYAFLGSAFAIAVSILVTWLEKFSLAKCYKYLEKFTAAIDQLFISGVGEEYLASLVKSSNESATQARHLKESLVTDLRDMLLHLAESQKVENERLATALSTTYRESGAQFAEQISGAIENSLKSPLDKIAGAVQTASGDQSGMVQNMLQDVLTAFMAKLDTTFGQQFTNLNEMMGQTVGAIQTMQTGFATLLQDMRQVSDDSRQGSAQLIEQLLSEMKTGQQAMQAGMNDMLTSLQASVAKIGAEGEGAGERMARQLEKMFADSEAREKAQAEHMAAFIEAIQNSVQQGQSATMEKMAASVEALGEQLGSLFGQIDKGQQQISANQQANQQSLHEQTQRVMSEVDDQIKRLIETFASQHQGTTETLRLFAEQTNRQIQDMQNGADKMRVAAERFEHAGDRVSEANHLTADVLNKAQSAGSSLSLATSELTSVVADYRNNREAVSKSIAMLELLAANTQSEQTTRNQFITDLKQHGERLQSYNREAQAFMENVSDVLGKGFEDFSEGVSRSLDKTLGKLDVEMAKASNLLAGSVEQIGESVSELDDVLSRVRA
ncbi:anti-phage defense ZorAB system ZorA [Pectobacterium carotovorum subsp. carotovorum]|uniref:type I Zorya anti-phage system protein ZorA1 n=1 Tax=Pectobacterium carotovorum TaxID=554 RepID=UPI0015DFDC53|nr:type I Zorya anti-phage system protein ZorA1 [Pectobacterium carotovorum]MBA0179849.1 anti-phage defense ZorAB system ZorA [Pectobacterium carotovorum]MBA0194760.1 anti-phage defense ZorAB system ZorA [Pectobacterium carotovorum]MBA0200579.1 anti-phage defense ZorAB system ZorA [Pectobacterium carotovorum]MBB1528587.1 anti-phage defense ZorAB system ZorA [Pectobacterium carotovorum subsp. carotovorum]MCA6967700.1 anti-phage defense ZorAB system protein ZorA [Pectobacterium carotovorum]